MLHTLQNLCILAKTCLHSPNLVYPPVILPAEPNMRDTANPAMSPRHVGSGAYAEPHNSATRLRAEALRPSGKLQTTSKVPLRRTAL